MHHNARMENNCFPPKIFISYKVHLQVKTYKYNYNQWLFVCVIAENIILNVYFKEKLIFMHIYNRLDQ